MMHAHRHIAGRGAAHRAGLTLVEMMLALASTALIGLAIAAMLTAVSYGTQGSKDARGLVVKAKAVNSRLSAAFRQGGVVLAANTADDSGDDWVILWSPGAEAESGAPRTSELHRIEYNSTARTIRSYRNLSPATDDTYAISDNFVTVVNGLVSNGTLAPEIWATDIDAMELRLDASSVGDARLASYRMTMRSGDLTETTVNATALRNRGVATDE